MHFIHRIFSNYVHNKMTNEESKSFILGTFAALTEEHTTDHQKVKRIEDVFRTVYLNQDGKRTLK